MTPSILARLLELQNPVLRKESPEAKLQSAFDLVSGDLESLEAEACQRLADRSPTPPTADTTSAHYTEALQKAENDGVHIEIQVAQER